MPAGTWLQKMAWVAVVIILTILGVTAWFINQLRAQSARLGFEKPRRARTVREPQPRQRVATERA